MRIAIVTPYAQGTGGVEVFNSLLISVLQSAGHHVTIVTAADGKKELSDAVMCKLVGMPWLTRKAFRACKINFDLVIANGEFAWGIEHPRCIQIFHGCYRGFLQRLRPHISLRSRLGLEKLARQQKKASVGKRVVAVSDFVRNILEADGVQVYASMPNAVDTTIFLPKEPIFPEKFLFIGSYNYFGKGFDVLEALAQKGLQIDCLTNQNPGPKLGWIQQIPHAQLPELVCQYGAFLFPSRFEGMALSPLEAMSCGLPVLTSEVGFGLELEQEFPQMVFHWDNFPSIDALAQQAVNILHARADYAEAMRALVIRHYSFDSFQTRWLALVEETSRA